MIKNILILLKGIAMGAADVVPGVSGGTIALLTGIYPRLINAITGLNLKSIKQFFSGDFKQFWRSIDGIFVLPLLIGIALAFLVLAHPIKYSIETYPIQTWSFFFGLIIASAILISINIPNKRPKDYIWMIPGAFFGFWIGSLSSIPFPSNELAVFIAGMIAIFAMILPGISGSFILLLLGMYQTILTAVTDKQWDIIIIFACGAVTGLMLFSRLIKWILKHFYNGTLLFLCGLMLGSLVKIWPWKSANGTNILPTQHQEPHLLFAVSMMIAAIIVVFTIETIGKKSTTNQ